MKSFKPSTFIAGCSFAKTFDLNVEISVMNYIKFRLFFHLSTPFFIVNNGYVVNKS